MLYLLAAFCPYLYGNENAGAATDGLKHLGWTLSVVLICFHLAYSHFATFVFQRGLCLRFETAARSEDKNAYGGRSAILFGVSCWLGRNGLVARLQACPPSWRNGRANMGYFWHSAYSLRHSATSLLYNVVYNWERGRCTERRRRRRNMLTLPALSRSALLLTTGTAIIAPGGGGVANLVRAAANA